MTKAHNTNTKNEIKVFKILIKTINNTKHFLSVLGCYIAAILIKAHQVFFILITC